MYVWVHGMAVSQPDMEVSMGTMPKSSKLDHDSWEANYFQGSTNLRNRHIIWKTSTLKHLKAICFYDSFNFSLISGDNWGKTIKS